MFSTKTIAAAAAVFAFTAIGVQGASAASSGSGFQNRFSSKLIINTRIRHQARRIGRGFANGRLNWIEARRARFELSHIRGFRSMYLNDGWLSYREARHLNRLLDRNSRRIRRFATNGNDWRQWRGRERGPFRQTFNRYNGFQ